MNIDKAIHFLNMNGFQADQISRVELRTPTSELGVLNIALLDSEGLNATCYEFDVKPESYSCGIGSICTKESQIQAISEWKYHNFDKGSGNWTSSKYIDFHPVQSDFLDGLIEALKLYLSSGQFILNIKGIRI